MITRTIIPTKNDKNWSHQNFALFSVLLFDFHRLLLCGRLGRRRGAMKKTNQRPSKINTVALTSASIILLVTRLQTSFFPPSSLDLTPYRFVSYQHYHDHLLLIYFMMLFLASVSNCDFLQRRQSTSFSFFFFFLI